MWGEDGVDEDDGPTAPLPRCIAVSWPPGFGPTAYWEATGSQDGE